MLINVLSLSVGGWCSGLIVATSAVTYVYFARILQDSRVGNRVDLSFSFFLWSFEVASEKDFSRYCVPDLFLYRAVVWSSGE